MKKKILIVLADGFEEIEALAPADVFRRLGQEVVLAGLAGKEVVGAHGIAVRADGELSAVDDRLFDAVVLPGGMPGAANLDRDGRMSGILERAARRGAVIGAICAAPFVLAKRGLLRDGRFTMYPGFDAELGGLRSTGRPAECDGKVVTGKGPGAVFPFAMALAEALGLRSECEKVYGSMFLDHELF